MVESHTSPIFSIPYSHRETNPGPVLVLSDTLFLDTIESCWPKILRHSLEQIYTATLPPWDLIYEKSRVNKQMKVGKRVMYESLDSQKYRLRAWDMAYVATA